LVEVDEWFLKQMGRTHGVTLLLDFRMKTDDFWDVKAKQSGGSSSTFLKKVSPPYPGLRNKPSTEAASRDVLPSCWLL
jgi:hypothetical protein